MLFDKFPFKLCKWVKMNYHKPFASIIQSQYKNKLHHDANSFAAPNDNQQTIPSEKDAININIQHNSRPDDKSHRNVYKLLVESINNKTTLLCIGFLFMSFQFASSAIDLFLLKW